MTELFVWKHYNFWLVVSAGYAFLALISGYINHTIDPAINYRLYYFEPKFIIIGIFSAAVLYFIFYAGNIYSKELPEILQSQAKLIFENKVNSDAIIIAVLLFFVIGPGEEIFWRGYVQDTLQLTFGDNTGWLIGSLIYGCIYLVSSNYVLAGAAFFCGLYWGFIYRRYKSLQPCIISHALWDITVFIILPIV
jgi:hypothetical protein